MVKVSDKLKTIMEYMRMRLLALSSKRLTYMTIKYLLQSLKEGR